MSNEHGGFPETPGAFPTRGAPPAAAPVVEAPASAPSAPVAESAPAPVAESAPAPAPAPAKPAVTAPAAKAAVAAEPAPEAPAPKPYKPPNPAVRIALFAGAGGTVLGFLIGLAVGSSGSKAEPAPAAQDNDGELSPVTSGAPGAKAPAAAAADGSNELALDLGKRDKRVVLSGPWTDVQIGPRTGARTAYTAKIGLNLTPGSDAYGLALIARADEDKLPVGIRVNGKDAGQWSVSNEWSMYSAVVEPGVLKSGANTVEVVLPEPPKDEKAQVAFVIDSFHLGPLQASATADLGSPNPRGALISGYYGREGEGENAQSWSAGKKTRVGLLLKPVNSTYDFELTASAYGPVQPLGVEAFVNGKSIGSVKVEKAQAYTFHAPPDTLVNGFNLVELAYEKTMKPSEVDKKSKDMRDLAIRFVRLIAKPATSQ